MNNHIQKTVTNMQKNINLIHQFDKIKMSNLNIYYININSIFNKLDDLELHLNSLSLNNNNKIIHILALTEIRIHEHQTPYFNIPHYTPFFCTREDGHGGCALYVHESISCCLTEKKSLNYVNHITVNLLDLSFSIMVVYKQPAVSPELFIEMMHELIENKRDVIVVGDMNIDLLSETVASKAYTNVVLSNGLFILNKIAQSAATRIGKRIIDEQIHISKTIIDHILSDCIDFSYNISICESELSDHHEIMIAIDNAPNISTNHTNTTTQIKKLNHSNFNRDLIRLLNSENTTSLNHLINGLKQCTNNNLSVETKINPSSLNKPWINEALISLINERNRYYRLHKKNPSNAYCHNKFHELNSIIKNKKKSMRADYNSRLINKNTNNPKMMWKHLNQIIYNKSSENPHCKALCDENNDPVMDSITIANIFNNYFKNVGKSLYEQSSIIPSPPFTHLSPRNPQSMRLFDTSSDEIYLRILGLKKSNSLKEYLSSNACIFHASSIAPILSNIINDHYHQGKFPNELKCARIIPIFKESNPLLPSNYRPISILPVFSKIFESSICDRINNFLNKHQIINKNQYGFQKNSGTLSAASCLVDTLQNKLDQLPNSKACCVFLDLKKAFDTVPHALLLNKLEHYGIRGNSNKLLGDYLKNRNQFVDVNGAESDNIINENQFGLPQGSNLGPLLFLIYINGLLDLKLNGIMILFADDAVLIHSHTDINTLNTKIQEDLNKISTWLSANKLTLNASKSKFMIIKGQQIPNAQFQLKINNAPIDRVNSFRYLGINLTDSLKWDFHIDSICRKIYGIASIMKRMGNKINQSTRISIYYSMINSHLSYLSPVWSSSASVRDMDKLQVAQNIAIRKIFSYDYYVTGVSTADILKKYYILNVRQQCLFNEHIFFYKILNKQIKCSFSVSNERNHQYSTRNASQPNLSNFRTNLGKFSIFRYCANNFYNTYGAQTNQSLNSFKKKLKKTLMN